MASKTKTKEPDWWDKIGKYFWVYVTVLLLCLYAGGWVSDYTQAIEKSQWTADDYIKMEQYEAAKERMVQAEELEKKAEEAKLNEWRETPEYKQIEQDVFNRYGPIGFIGLGMFLVITILMNWGRRGF